MTKLSVLKIEIDQSLDCPIAIYSISSRKNRTTNSSACLRYRGRLVVIKSDEVRVATSVKGESRWFVIDEVIALCLDRREVNDYMQKVSDSCESCSVFDPIVSTQRVIAAIGSNHPMIQVQ